MDFMQNVDEIASVIAQSVDAQVQTPGNMVIDLSKLSDWMNTPPYYWYKLPDNEAYKSLPGMQGRFEEDTVCFACAGMALFIELICPKIKDKTQRDYYKGLFYRGYVQGLSAFEHEYNMRCSDDMAPALKDKRAVLFDYYSELRGQYKNKIGFSADVIEKMGYNSGLMLSVAHKLRLMDKALKAISGSLSTAIAPIEAQATAHFSVKKSHKEIQRILVALQEHEFVSTDTTIDTFYYRMTGIGTSTSNKIKWIKKGKRRKNNISKSSLVYFLKKFASYNVDQTLDCKNRIEEIFGISLSVSTITRTSNCEYGTEIDNIVRA